MEKKVFSSAKRYSSSQAKIFLKDDNSFSFLINKGRREILAFEFSHAALIHQMDLLLKMLLPDWKKDKRVKKL